MWRELVEGIRTDHIFFPPATLSLIREVEDVLRVQLPIELVNFLCETNGLAWPYDEWFIWSTDKMIDWNLRLRSENWIRNVDPNGLLFVSITWNGDYFAYKIRDGISIGTDVWYFDHEDSSLQLYAHSLKEYLVNNMTESAFPK